MLSTIAGFGQGTARRQEGCSGNAPGPAAFCRGCRLSRGLAGPLQLEYFPRLVIRPDHGGFPQCHSPGIQKVFPVFTWTPSSGFCLLPWSQALGDGASPAAAARAQWVISPRYGEELSKHTKTPEEQQKPKDPRRGRDPQVPGSGATRFPPHSR